MVEKSSLENRSEPRDSCVLPRTMFDHDCDNWRWLQRFLPSEFGHDVDRADPVEPGLAMYNEKRRVRRATEESGVPFTYICCNSIAAWPYYDNCHPAELPPPLDQLQIYGDGSVKGKLFSFWKLIFNPNIIFLLFKFYI